MEPTLGSRSSSRATGLARRRRHRTLAASLLLAAALLTPAGSTAAVLDTYLVSFDAAPADHELEMLEGVVTSAHRFRHFPVVAVIASPADLRVVANLPGVLRVDPNVSYRPLLAQSTATMGATSAWELGWTGRGVGIAVIDTGIDGTHPDLCAAASFCQGTPVKTVQNVKILGRQSLLEPVVVLEDQVNTDTTSGHGTHVAGIAGGAGVASVEPGRYRGVAPDAHLIGLGTGEAVEAVNVLAAFDWVIEHAQAYNIRVVNNSWGPGKGTPYDPTYPVQRAIDAAHAAGLTVVFGAGNDGPATDSLNAFSANPHAISVAAGEKGGHLAFFSSRGIPGSELWRPTVTAPGYHITAPRARTGLLTHLSSALAPNPDPVAVEDEWAYASGSGTSMAAPHVAGLVALMQQAAYATRGVYLHPDEVHAILEATAVRQDPARGVGGLPNYQPYTMGAGYVDAVAAVRAAADGLAGRYVAPATEVRGFAGRVGPAALVPLDSFETLMEVRPDAISLDVMIDWALLANDVDLDLYSPQGSLVLSTFLRCNPNAQPNGYSSFCSSQPNERITVPGPTAGTWRAVVRGGTLSTVEDVTGLWAVAYPPGTTLPPPTAATTVTVDATLALGVATGTTVEVTARVTDAAGAPVPGARVAWSSSGPGAVAFGETQTRADGRAAARVVSDLPGVQRVQAEVAGVTGHLDVTWLGLDLPALQASTPGRASGGGWLRGATGRHTVGFFASYEPGATAPGGELTYQAPSGPTVRGEGVERLTISGVTAVVQGPASVNGTGGYRYRLEVTDGGTPGRDADRFRLIVTHPLQLLYRYEVDGLLGGGNLQVRAH